MLAQVYGQRRLPAAELRLARLLIFGALNWSVQWYDRRKGATLDELTDAALRLFTGAGLPVDDAAAPAAALEAAR